MRNCVIYVLAFLILLTGCKGSDTRAISKQTPVANQSEETELSEDIKQILKRKIDVIKSEIQQDIVLEAVRESNSSHKNTQPSEIQALDAEWRNTEGTAGMISEFLTNPCAIHLQEIQKREQGFSEIFVTNKYGLNVCQTNKTSDFYQADEDWWLEGFATGKGREFFGVIEYDDSAHSEAISIYVPVMNLTSGHAIGVTKAVVALDQIKAEL